MAEPTPKQEDKKEKKLTKEERLRKREIERGMDPDAPRGVAFYSIKSGDTHYAKKESQIDAYINSSDMGINASRGQDFGWRLAPEWVEAVKKYRANSQKMGLLKANTDGGKVTNVKILYAIYNEQLRNYYQVKEENANPFEQDYLDMVSGRKSAKKD